MSNIEPPSKEIGSPVAPPAAQARSNWPILVGLLGPAVIAIVVARYGTWYDAPNVTLVASGIGGVVSTFFTVCRRSMAPWRKILLVLVLLPVYSIASLIIAIFGCAISGNTR